MKISVKGDIKKILKANEQAKKIIKPATAAALNKTIRTVQSATTKEISRITGIKPQKRIREKLIIIKATRLMLTAKINAKPAGINLIEFVTPSKRNPQAFRVKTRKGFKYSGVKAKAWNKQTEYKGTFIGKAKNSGKMLVYSRIDKTNPRSKIEAKHGPSIPVTFLNYQVQRMMDSLGRITWAKNIEHEIQWRLSKIS